MAAGGAVVVGVGREWGGGPGLGVKCGGFG